LSSVVSLTSLSSIGGISDHDTNPVIPRDSFTCADNVFSSNRTPFNGAAISVSLSFAIAGEITNSKFEDNSGGIGGAVFFASPGGSLSISKSWFERNAAAAGSHIYLKCLSFVSYDTRWIVSTGVRSGIETSTLGTFTLNQANFFRNGHGIRFGSEKTNVLVENSCFLNYDDVSGFPENLGLFEGQAIVNFKNTWLNKRLLNGEKKADEVKDWLMEMNKTETAPAEECRLIPTPSMTTNAQLNFDAWFSIISIGFFVIVSVLGIVMVTCCHSTPKGEQIHDETDGLEHELDELHE
jgi:hypothetical protein